MLSSVFPVRWAHLHCMHFPEDCWRQRRSAASEVIAAFVSEMGSAWRLRYWPLHVMVAKSVKNFPTRAETRHGPKLYLTTFDHPLVYRV